MENDDPLAYVAERLGTENYSVAMALLFIVRELKRQPGFNATTFNRRILKEAKASESRGEKKLAFYLSVAGGRKPKRTSLET